MGVMSDMKRTNPSIQSNKELQAMNEIIGWARQGMMRVLRGSQYSGARDIYQALGYERDPKFSNFYAQYVSQDIAAAIIDRPIKTTWRGPVALLEADDDEETPLEKKWLELERKLHLKSNFIRLDTLAGLGRYAVLFMGFSDVRNRGDLSNPVAKGGSLQLLYVRPLSEDNAAIHTYETDPANERYGLPRTYSLTITAPGGNKTETLEVHYSRILHVAEGLLEGNFIGRSRLEPVFNRLKDLEKLVGGSAEMFWRGARPGYYGNVSPDADLDDETKEALKTQLDEYEHNLRRFLVSSGIDMKELASQVADPKGHVDIQIQMISAATGIPQRILTGSERGELASSQDRDNWLEAMQSRREEFAEPLILYPFVDLLIEYGVLPKPAFKGRKAMALRDYTVKWQDLWSTSQKEKAELGRLRVQSLKDYLSTPMAYETIPPDMFFKMILGLEDDDVELINQYIERQMEEEPLEDVDLEGEPTPEPEEEPEEEVEE
jgi:hypothetical protein